MHILSCYQLLNETPLSVSTDIKSSYKKLALINHPDKGGSSEKFIELTLAYDTILKYHDTLQQLVLVTSQLSSLTPDYLLYLVSYNFK